MNVNFRVQNFNVRPAFGCGEPGCKLGQRFIREMNNPQYHSKLLTQEQIEVRKRQIKAHLDRIAPKDDPEHDEILLDLLDDPIRRANLEEDEEFDDKIIQQ